MKEPLAFTVQGGRLRIIKTTGSANFSEGTDEHFDICPSNKRWLVLSTCLYADVSATRNITESGDELFNYAAAGTGILCDVPTGGDRLMLPNWLKAGEYVQYKFGAAQGATAWVKTRIIEVDV